MKTSIEDKVAKEIGKSTKHVICLPDLKTRGTYAAKTKALSSLNNSGVVKRIFNGVYFIPRNDLKEEKDLPLIDLVLGIARKNNWRVVIVDEEFKEGHVSDDHDIYIRSNGPTKQYVWQNYLLHFVNESPRSLPSPYYNINRIVNLLRQYHDGEVPSDFIKAMRKTLSKEEYKNALSTLSSTYSWVRAELEHILKKKPKKFQKSYIKDNVLIVSDKD